MTTPSPNNPHEQIKILCGMLAESLECPAGDTTILQDQTQILNALFHATLAANLDLTPTTSEYRQERQQGWLKLALQIQKQCMDTAKTDRAIRYLDSLTTLNIHNSSLPAHPLPPLSVERTEQGE